MKLKYRKKMKERMKLCCNKSKLIFIKEIKVLCKKKQLINLMKINLNLKFHIRILFNQKKKLTYKT